MKRLYFAGLLLLNIFPIAAQKIELDSQKDNGSRVLLTEQIGYGLQRRFMGVPVADGGERFLTFGCTITENDTLYNVGLSLSRYQERMTMAKGKSLLLKLDNDDVMTLQTYSDIT